MTDTIEVPRDLLEFLAGEGELDGMWFGEHPPRKPFWWRKYIRALLAQPASVPDEVESIDDRIRILSRKLGLAKNQNPSPAQLRAAGIELVRPPPPKSPPATRQDVSTLADVLSEVRRRVPLPDWARMRIDVAIAAHKAGGEQ